MKRTNRSAADSTPQDTDPWKHFQALLRNGFRPPTGTGRCRTCGFHTKTQGHRGGCPKSRKPLHSQRLHNKAQQKHNGSAST